MPDITFSEFINSLPTTDPAINGALWKNGDSLKISGSAPSGGSQTEHFPAYGLTQSSVVKTFTSPSLTPPDFITATSGISASIIAESSDSVVSGSTAVLTFGNGGNLGDGRNDWMEFQVYADATFKQLLIRYAVNGESGYDGLRVNVDGAEILAALGNTPYTTFTFDLAPGPHTIRLRYTADSAVAVGYQNARISRLEYPTLVPASSYVHGDTMFHNGRLWHCINTGTALEPTEVNTSDWAPFATINIETVTAENYTFLGSESYVVFFRATAQVVTVPSSPAVGCQISGHRGGVGNVSFVADTGVTIHSADNLFSLRVLNSAFTLTKISATEWALTGDLAT